MSCDVGEVTKNLENELSFHRYTYVKAILQPFLRFSHVTSSSLNSSGEPPTTYSPHAVLQAMNRNKRLGIANISRIGVCKTRGVEHKEPELQSELKDMKVDIAIIPETKKKLKGSKELEHCILLLLACGCV